MSEASKSQRRRRWGRRAMWEWRRRKRPRRALESGRNNIFPNISRVFIIAPPSDFVLIGIWSKNKIDWRSNLRLWVVRVARNPGCDSSMSWRWLLLSLSSSFNRCHCRCRCQCPYRCRFRSLSLTSPYFFRMKRRETNNLTIIPRYVKKKGWESSIKTKKIVRK